MDYEQEARRAKRDSVFRVATITLPGVEMPLVSRARDVSADGARIEVVDGLQTGMSVHIAIGGKPAVPAKVAWITDGKCGIVFDGDAPADRAQFGRADGAPTAGWLADLPNGYRR